MSKQDSITSALGLRDEVWDEIEKIVENSWDQNDTISDAFLQSGSEIRDQEFGDVGHRPDLSKYEIKLIIAGFMIGCRRSKIALNDSLIQAHMSLMFPPEMRSFIEALEAMRKRKEKEEED